MGSYACMHSTCYVAPPAGASHVAAHPACAEHPRFPCLLTAHRPTCLPIPPQTHVYNDFGQEGRIDYSEPHTTIHNADELTWWADNLHGEIEGGTFGGGMLFERFV